MLYDHQISLNLLQNWHRKCYLYILNKIAPKTEPWGPHFYNSHITEN